MVQLVRSVKLSKRKQNVWTLDRLENVDKIKRMSILARLSKNLLPGPDRSIIQRFFSDGSGNSICVRRGGARPLELGRVVSEFWQVINRNYASHFNH
jgi:hypothetical protein